MAESRDFDPGPWVGHDFSEARKHFDRHVGRSYGETQAKKVTTKGLLPDRLSTKSHFPVIVLIDGTGSMGDWPATLFSKLPYLDHELRKEYLGPDVEICFGMTCDAYAGDAYPLQMQPFSKGVDLKERLKALAREENCGGTGNQESYELGALYVLHQIDLPAECRPTLILIGDERPYQETSVANAKKHAGVTLEKAVSTKEVFQGLRDKGYSVYLVRKPYLTMYHKGTPTDRSIYTEWVDLLGEQYIANLPEARGIMDTMFGIFARESNKIEYFRKEVEGRQRPEQVETVYAALETIFRGSERTDDGDSSDSKLRDPLTGKRGRDLL